MILVGKNKYRYGRMYLSHMAANSIEELHSMAAMLNIDKKYFQNKPGKPHYDICQKKKQLAIALGAKEVNDREIIELFKTETR